LPREEARAKTGGDGLGFAGAVVMAEAVIGEAECFGNLPAVTVGAGEEGIESLSLQIGESDLCQHRVPQLRLPSLIHSPKSFWVQFDGERVFSYDGDWVVAVAQ